eukprot:GHRQ01021964.1.p1 GENE.GHRQ01021964.1~~GHRQ01021964.1.p1  ORF type:complete len:115 (-),score=15.24 GHRQ01021964.1:514-858(-)
MSSARLRCCVPAVAKCATQTGRCTLLTANVRQCRIDTCAAAGRPTLQHVNVPWLVSSAQPHKLQRRQLRNLVVAAAQLTERELTIKLSVAQSTGVKRLAGSQHHQQRTPHQTRQ